MNAAHQYAKDFLRPYVERGDSLEKVCCYPRVSVCATFYTVQIGGSVYFDGRTHHLRSHQLAIKEMGGQPCFEVFEIEVLFAELGVLPRPVQLSLW